MEIHRKGASADHGSRGISLELAPFKWQTSSDRMLGKTTHPVRDFATRSRHQYRVLFELEEIGGLIEELAASVTKISDDAIRAALRPRVADLLKIATIASNS